MKLSCCIVPNNSLARLFFCQREIRVSSLRTFQDCSELIELIESAFVQEPSDGLTWNAQLNAPGYLTLVADSDNGEGDLKERLLDVWLDRLHVYEEACTAQGAGTKRLIAALKQLVTSLVAIRMWTVLVKPRQLRENHERRKILHDDLFGAAWNVRNWLTILASAEMPVAAAVGAIDNPSQPTSPQMIKRTSDGLLKATDPDAAPYRDGNQWCDVQYAKKIGVSSKHIDRARKNGCREVRLTDRRKADTLGKPYVYRRAELDELSESIPEEFQVKLE